MPPARFRALFAVLVVALTDQTAQAREEHLARLGVNAWHAKGHRGSGVTVAVLDSGFRGYRDHLGKALPPHVTAKSFRRDGNLEAKDSPHGVLCAEVVHTLAPGADLVLANWEPDRPEAFIDAVKWARGQGASIFTCSIVMPGWSDGRGGGDVHGELRKALGDALFFASAGNLARRCWSGLFRGDDQESHCWRPGRTANGVIPWGRQPVSVEITWRGESTFRLTVTDAEGRAVAPERSLGAPGVRGRAVRFVPEAGTLYVAAVERITGSGGEFRLVVLGGELEIATRGNSMAFPGDGESVIAVGAAADAGPVASSSTGGLGRIMKPDCLAPVPFPSSWRAAPFGGTSAAAPQAAALAALIRARSPSANAVAVREILLPNCGDAAPGPRHIRLPKP